MHLMDKEEDLVVESSSYHGPDLLKRGGRYTPVVSFTGDLQMLRSKSVASFFEYRARNMSFSVLNVGVIGSKSVFVHDLNIPLQIL